MIAAAAIGVIAVFFILSVVLVVLRRIRRARAANFGGNPARRSSNAPKPSNPSVPFGHPAYYQTPPPPPPPFPPAPAHTPQYPPHGYETYPTYSQSQWVPPSPIRSIPQPTTPTSSVSTRAPSGTTSRPISSVDPIPLSVRSSAHRSEPTTNPSSLSPLSSSRSIQRDVVESPRHSRNSSPSLAVPATVSPPSPRVFGAATSSPRNPPASSLLAPMSTGASYAIDEPPPAYTPA